MNAIKILTRNTARQVKIHQKRRISTLSDESKRQSELFNLEKKRQVEAIGRIEKIEVQFEGPPESSIFMMNKLMSTPYDVARQHCFIELFCIVVLWDKTACAVIHMLWDTTAVNDFTDLGEKYMNKSALALLNGNTIWHMHRPFPDACNLSFLHYNIAQPAAVNKAFWRTCSFILGAVISNSFKDNIKVQLHSFPSPNVRSGSFVYDVQLSLDNWKPTESELRVLSIDMIKLNQQNLNLETLDVHPDIALAIFKNNPHKTLQIPDIAAQNNGNVTLFRVGHHIDISRGPMISNTNQIGRTTLTSVHKLDTDIEGGPIYRFQGVALPSCLVINHFAYGLIEERGKKLNPARIPGSNDTISEDNTFVTQLAA